MLEWRKKVFDMNRLEPPNTPNDVTHYLPANWKYFYPLYRPPSSPSSRQNHTYDVQSLLPSELSRDPRLWTRQNVQTWIQWCQDEFDLPSIDGSAHFTMNGKALCLLLRSDFTERSPRAGDILYNVIQILLREATDNHPAYNGIRMYGFENGTGPDISLTEGMTSSWPVINSDFHNLGHVIHQPRVQVSPSTSGVESTVTLSPAPSTDSHSGGSPRLHHTSPNNKQKIHEQNGSVSDYEDSGTDSPVPSMVLETVQAEVKKAIPVAPEPTPTLGEPITNGRLLWDFLHQLLNDPAQRYSSCIRWFNHESGIFKITDPNGLARLWGLQKNHLNMNFDKMSRALRYYYRVNILRKVQGERHCYQFLRQPTELKNCKQRALLNKLRMNDKPLDMSIHSNGLGGIKTEEP